MSKRLSGLVFGDADAGQCNGAAYGASAAPAGTWTPEVRIDTDNRPGGCYQSFAVYDPLNERAGLRIKIDFRPDGDGPCDQPGEREIPITTSGASKGGETSPWMSTSSPTVMPASAATPGHTPSRSGIPPS